MILGIFSLFFLKVKHYYLQRKELLCCSETYMSKTENAEASLAVVWSHLYFFTLSRYHTFLMKYNMFFCFLTLSKYIPYPFCVIHLSLHTGKVQLHSMKYLVECWTVLLKAPLAPSDLLLRCNECCLVSRSLTHDHSMWIFLHFSRVFQAFPSVVELGFILVGSSGGFLKYMKTLLKK